MRVVRCYSAVVMNEFLDHVSAKRLELQEARHRVDILEAELRAWETALRIISKQDPAMTNRARLLSSEQNRSSETTRRGINTNWRTILTVVVRHHQDIFDLDDIEAASEKAGHPTNRNTIRSQMANYVNAGLVERVDQGRFRLTPSGAVAVGIVPTETGSSPATSPDMDATIEPLL